ncbi:1-aminocyclopropane-1-carboxylate oxidase10 [Sesamum alatum]|uniref:1-aminocyclopropane-1-carboxylate oxidase10 n=1 Tax=Sesamum alatum TaxID=300844 RepID=A0AAE1XYC0_9LAMI|nr:1-aminocyclopropane-1-carboxylate oxidase10 [Sesamum alatum]
MERVRFTSSVPKRETDAACWRDLLTIVYQDDELDPQVVPLACREEVQEYVKHMIPLRESMAGLLSEALGLSTDHLSNMECMKSEALACLYYPVCPEPDKTLGQLKHSDASFITLLMQDSVGGLQILHNNQWVDVPPVPGSFIANIGDLMQIISNDKFISAEHRVVAQPSDSRVSVACFFTPSTSAISKPLMPIKELVCDDSPAVYKEFLFMEYIQYALGRGQHVHSALPHFRIR